MPSSDRLFMVYPLLLFVLVLAATSPLAQAATDFAAMPPGEARLEARAQVIWHPSGGAADVLVINSSAYDIGPSLIRSLDELGIAYDLVTTYEWTAVDLSPYDEVFIGMNGGAGAFAGPEVAHVADWTSSGGHLHLIGGAEFGPFAAAVYDYLVRLDASYTWTTVSGDPDLTVVDPHHYLGRNLPPSYDFINHGASHYMIRSVDPGVRVAVVNGDGWPALFAKTIGAGRLDWFVNDVSFYWDQEADYQVFRQVVDNMLHPGVLGANPLVLVEGLEPGLASSRPFSLINHGDSTLVVNDVAYEESWFSLVTAAATVAALPESLPPGSSLSFDAHFDAAALGVGIYADTVHVHYERPDSDGVMTGDSLLVPVSLAVTHPPSLSLPASVLALECGDLAFTVSGSDPDGDELTYFGVNLPEHASIYRETGAFLWSPVDGGGAFDGGTTLTFVVTDGVFADTASTVVTVITGDSVKTAIGFDETADGTPIVNDADRSGEISGEEWLTLGVRFSAYGVLNVAGTGDFMEPTSLPNGIAVTADSTSVASSGSLDITFPDPVTGANGTINMVSGQFAAWVGADATSTEERGSVHFVNLYNTDGKLMFSEDHLPGDSFCRALPGIARVEIVFSDGTALDDFTFGSLGPKLTLGVLQNPVITNQVDIYVTATGPLSAPPTIEVNDDRLDVETLSSGAGGLYRSRYMLVGSGDIHVTAAGGTTLGASSAALDFTSFHLGREGGSMACGDGSLMVSAPAGAVSAPIFVTVVPAASARSWEIGPRGVSMPGLELRYRVPGAEPDPAELAFRRRAGDGWEILPTTYDADTHELRAVLPETGTIEVRRGAGGTAPTVSPVLMLAQNEPNPFGVGTSIRFSLPAKTAVSLAIFDVRGRLVRTLFAGELDAGAHAVPWDGMDTAGMPAPTGVYYYRLAHPGGTETRKMIRLE